MLFKTKKKNKWNKYFEIANLVCTILFLNLLGLLTINIGCKELNPDYTTTSATEADSQTIPTTTDKGTTTEIICEESTTSEDTECR